MIRSFRDRETQALFERRRSRKLTGDRRGHYSIRINERWRICFRWQRGDAFDVEIVDYH